MKIENYIRISFKIWDELNGVMVTKHINLSGNVLTLITITSCLAIAVLDSQPSGQSVHGRIIMIKNHVFTNDHGAGK